MSIACQLNAVHVAHRVDVRRHHLMCIDPSRWPTDMHRTHTANSAVAVDRWGISRQSQLWKTGHDSSESFL